MSKPKGSTQGSPVVFEISNEIANKIGGIYTVIASKAPEMQRLFGPGNYIAIGLYNSFKAKNDFEELETPADYQEAFNNIRMEGIDVKYGRWISGGNVETILVDPSYLLDVPLVTGKKDRKIDSVKGLLWDWYNIDSLWMHEVFDPMVAFGWASGVVIEHLLTSSRFRSKNVIAHFHEWISGPGLLYLKKHAAPVAKVFMTHATQLGRNIAMGDEDINEIIDQYLKKGETIPPQKAYQYRVEGTHQLEVICAREADLFVTVSEAVAREAECMLGKKPDYIIPNGINFSTIASKKELATIHKMARAVINRFITAYFSPYYQIHTENLLVIHISGRYEFHNKGIDVFLASLREVNQKLKQIQGATRDVLAFIWVPAPVSKVKPPVMEALAFAQSQRTILHAPLLRIEKWLSTVGSEYEKQLKEKTLRDFFTREEIEKVNQLGNQMPKISDSFGQLPPVCPFKVNENDAIYQTLLELELINKPDDKVKVIFYPIYLSENDKLLGLNYYDAVAGCDMGVYPSTYEPFGLTPLEALALGVPAITTDLSGFGSLVSEQTSEEALGIHVLKRRGLDNDTVANKLAKVIIAHSKLSTTQVAKARKIAREISELYSWRNIIHEYKKSYQLALRKINE